MSVPLHDFALRRRHRLASRARRLAPRQWFTARRLRLGALGVAIAAAVIVVGLHRHPNLHGDLRVYGNDGTVVSIPEWRLTGEAPAQPLDPISPGTFTFQLANADGVPHDFIVIRTDADPAALPTSGGQIDLGRAGEVVGQISAVNPGQTGDSGAIYLEEGKYVLVCSAPGHYNDGMYYQLTVK